jgi:hypothetical protein
MFATGVNDTGGKFAGSIVDTGGKFASGINNASKTGGKICHWYRWYRCTLNWEYLREFSNKFEIVLMEYSGAGKLIHEKNQKQKISWHCPFKHFIPVFFIAASPNTYMLQYRLDCVLQLVEERPRP